MVRLVVARDIGGNSLPKQPSARAFHVAKRRVYADAHIPKPLIDELRTTHWKVKSVIEELGDGATDDQVLRAAKRARMPLLTLDVHFWDDRVFPLAGNPGIIILDVPDGLIYETLATFVVLLMRFYPTGSWVESKAKVSQNLFVYKTKRGTTVFRLGRDGVYEAVSE